MWIRYNCLPISCLVSIQIQRIQKRNRGYFSGYDVTSHKQESLLFVNIYVRSVYYVGCVCASSSFENKGGLLPGLFRLQSSSKLLRLRQIMSFHIFFFLCAMQVHWKIENECTGCFKLPTKWGLFLVDDVNNISGIWKKKCFGVQFPTPYICVNNEISLLRARWRTFCNGFLTLSLNIESGTFLR